MSPVGAKTKTLQQMEATKKTSASFKISRGNLPRRRLFVCLRRTIYFYFFGLRTLDLDNNRDKISDFHVFRALIENMSEKVATKFRLWASLLVSAEYWNRETIKRVRREVEGQTSEIKEQGITGKKREWMEWMGQIRLNMLAIKLHKDLFFTSIYTHTYRSTVVALLLHHIYINI